MDTKTNKTRNKPTADALGYRRILKESFPETGKVRVPQIAAHLGIGASTWWLYVKDGRVLPPTKYGARVAVWDASYIRQLADSGIPPKTAAAA
jgi:predicted DNA-binding transcriptional regulator AlpA